MISAKYKCRICNVEDLILVRALHLEMYHKDLLDGLFDPVKEAPKPVTEQPNTLREKIDDIDTTLKGIIAVPDGLIAKCHFEFEGLESKVTNLQLGHNYRLKQLEDTTQKRLKDLEDWTQNHRTGYFTPEIRRIDKRIENLENVIGRIHSVKFKDIEKKLQELEYDDRNKDD